MPTRRGSHSDINGQKFARSVDADPQVIDKRLGSFCQVGISERIVHRGVTVLPIATEPHHDQRMARAAGFLAFAQNDERMQPGVQTDPGVHQRKINTRALTRPIQHLVGRADLLASMLG